MRSRPGSDEAEQWRSRLKREVIKLKAERDILKKSLLREGIDGRFGFIAKHRGDLAGGLGVRDALCLAGWLLCVAETAVQSAPPKR
jgi:hypothetical protein